MSLRNSIKRGLAGVISGCFAFGGGLLITLLLMGGRVDRFLSSSGAQVDFAQVAAQYGESAAPGTAKVVSWFYFGAHTISFELQAQALLAGSESVSFSLSDSAVWMEALWVVPPVVLVGFGYLYARGYANGSAGSLLGGAVALTVGYAIAGAVAFAASYWTLDAGVGAIVLGPAESGIAMLLAYPAVFGGLGCVLGTLGSGSETRREYPPAR